MYILDTNILNVLLYPTAERERIRAKISAVGDENVWFSVVTVHEKFFHGYLPTIHRALNKPNEVRAWHDAKILMDRFRESHILEFTDEDYRHYREIYGNVKKAAMDCRIAASALSRNWIAATFDKADFHRIKSRVPELKFEDWSTNTI
ncbi:MAG: type II toxin-antitoxin system VapC family toxin [Pyrinomonadaceae bacterium]|nr:type II toxin-antitoxin system VapC family toxin [Pyrinomonadaceae bacterium]